MADYVVDTGDMRTRITFQVPTEARDAGGAQAPTYADAEDFPTVWSRWVNAHGQEHGQNALKDVQRATVTVRYRSDVRSTWRVIKDGEAWEIISIDPVQDRNRWIEMVVQRAKGTV
jgi:SPP1 family predicted phage head-tail adaptor